MDTVVDLCMDLHLVRGSLPGLVIGRIPFILTSLFTFIDQDLELENYYYYHFLLLDGVDCAVLKTGIWNFGS